MGHRATALADRTVALVTRSTAPLVIAPECGIAAVGALVLANSPLAFVAAVLVVPLLTVVGGRAAALWWRTEDRRLLPDRRGYPVASVAVMAASLFGLSSLWVPGPAQLIALSFTRLGWIRRDTLVAGSCAAALLAVAPIDGKGPLAWTHGNTPEAGLALIAVAIVMIGLGSLTVLLRNRTRDSASRTPSVR